MFNYCDTYFNSGRVFVRILCSAGIDALLFRAGLSLLEDQEEKEGEQTENVPFSSSPPPASPAPATFVRSKTTTSAVSSFQYTDFLSTLIANSNDKADSDAPLAVEFPLSTDALELEREQEQERLVGFAQNEQESPEEKTDSSVDTTFHYVDALSALIANNNAHHVTQPVLAMRSGHRGDDAPGRNSPFVSLSTSGLHPSVPLAMETAHITTATNNEALAMERNQTGEQLGTPPEESMEPPLAMETPEDGAVLSPRSTDDSELRALPSPTGSILSGDCFSVTSGAMDSRLPEVRDGSVTTDVGSKYGSPLSTNIVVDTVPTGAASGGNVDDEVNVKVVRRVPSKRKASPRSPGETSAAFSKPRSPRSEFE